MEILLTVVGIQYYCDEGDIEPGQEVTLIKEPSNKYDKEAIAVLSGSKGLEKIGYIANSIKTVAKGSYSAGRLYDKIPDSIKAKIILVLDEVAVCKVEIE